MDPKQTPPAETSQKPAAAPKKQIQDTLRSKRVWGLLAVLLFFIGVGTTVPVGKIPFLRSLVMAMGYSQDDLKSLTLFEALFTWNENRKLAQGEKPLPGEVAVFNKAQSSAQSARGANAAAQTGLINLRAINASLRKQGKSAEQITGNIGEIDEDNPSRAAVNLNNPNAEVSTDANQSQVADVYFGSDNSLSPRNKKDGYNSVNQLKKAPGRASIARAGGQQSWLFSMIDKAFEQDSELSGLEDNLRVSGLSSGLGALKNPGEGKASRDMYWAWLMGRAGRRTPNVILKKTLASTSFDGAAVPTTVFNEFGFSGVAINAEDLAFDADMAEKLLDKKMKCKKIAEEVEKDINTYATNIKGEGGGIAIVRRSLESVTCGDVSKPVSSKGFDIIRDNCTRMQTAYAKLSGGECGSYVTKVDCSKSSRESEATALAGANLTFSTACETEREKCNAKSTPEEQASCRAAVDARAMSDLNPDGINEFIDGYYDDSNRNAKIDNDEEKNLNSNFPTIDNGLFNSVFGSLGGGDTL